MAREAKNIGTAGFRLIRGYVKLFFLELKLAKASIKPLLISIVILIALTMGFWSTLLAFVGYGFYYLSHNVILTITYTVGFNLVILIIIALIAWKYYRQMLFLKTRKYFKTGHL